MSRFEFASCRSISKALIRAASEYALLDPLEEALSPRLLLPDSLLLFLDETSAAFSSWTVRSSCDSLA